jgi:hypothetical protein
MNVINIKKKKNMKRKPPKKQHKMQKEAKRKREPTRKSFYHVPTQKRMTNKTPKEGR